MTLAPYTLSVRRCRRAFTRGFTFVEVLFAIMILGIGFIMIAAMLPVAIKQTEDTQSDITGRAICDAAFSLMYPQIVLATDTNVVANQAEFGAAVALFQPDRADFGGANTPSDRLMDRIRGTTQLSADRRFAYTFFLRRTAAEAKHEAIVVAMQTRNLSEYPPQLFDGPRTGNSDPGNITYDRPRNDNGPHLITFTITEGDTLSSGNISAVAPDRLVINSISISGGNDVMNAADFQTLVRPGTYIIAANGRIFRVEQLRSGTNNEFDLQPGTNGDLPLITFPNGSFAADTTFSGSSTGYVVGAGLRDPRFEWNAGSNPFTGPTQDIAVMKMTLR
jgi:prepilin-type N-terminal cleavage/methylation domain-containing protein